MGSKRNETFAWMDEADVEALTGKFVITAFERGHSSELVGEYLALLVFALEEAQERRLLPQGEKDE